MPSVTSNTGKGKGKGTAAAEAAPSATNEAKGVPSAGSSLEWTSSSEENDYDDDDHADSDAEVLRVRKAGADQRSGLDDGAKKPLALESASTVVWRKPQNSKSSLWAFFHQGMDRGGENAKCTVEATSNLAQQMVAHHKDSPAHIENIKKESRKNSTSRQGHHGVHEEGGRVGSW